MSNNTNHLESILAQIENNGASTLATLQQLNLDWSVNRVPLSTPDGTPVNYYANQRSDNGAILQVVSEGYSILQNEELVELCEAMAKTFDYKVHKGGELHGGRKVFVQLETDSVTGIGANNDTINRYITAVNSFDGSTAVAFGSLGFTISCQNTFYRAARHENMTRIKHTTNMRERIEQATRQVEQVSIEENTLYEKFFRMASAEATPAHIQSVIKRITEVDIMKTVSENKTLHSTRKTNIAESLIASIQKEMSYKGDTLWGLLSGVTHYTSHVQSAPRRDNGRLESKLVGLAQHIDTMAFEYLETFVN